jgi:tRNA pseudouridine13 synthase
MLINLMSGVLCFSHGRNHMASKRLELFGSDPVIGDLAILSEANDTSITTGGRNSQHACPITAENISQFTLHDVILPMPGHDVVYPSNLAQEYREFMLSDGIDNLDMKRKVKDHSLPGAYRSIVAKATGVEAEFYRYDDYEVPLSRSDIDVRNGVEAPKSVENGEKLAVVLTFELVKGSYATMAVREICECQGGLGKVSASEE